MMVDDWIFSEEALNNTVSIQRGMKVKDERKCRRDGVKLIMKIGPKEGGLNLKQNPTLATAAVYFHRFYMYHSFQEYPKEITALTCIFLAGKVEETPKKCKYICQVAEARFPELYQGKYRSLPEEVMGVERVLLQVLRFDLRVEHPYKFIQPYLKEQGIPHELIREYVQKSWTFTNDSFYTPICLIWEPQIIAVGMIHLAFNLVKNDNNDHAFMPPEEWWNKYVSNLSPKLLETVCHLVLDFYTLTKEEQSGQQEEQQQQQQLPPAARQPQLPPPHQHQQAGPSHQNMRPQQAPPTSHNYPPHYHPYSR